MGMTDLGMEGVVAVMKIHIEAHLYGYPCFLELWLSLSDCLPYQLEISLSSSINYRSYYKSMPPKAALLLPRDFIPGTQALTPMLIIPGIANRYSIRKPSFGRSNGPSAFQKYSNGK